MEHKTQPLKTVKSIVEDKVNETRNLDGEALFKSIMSIKNSEAFHLAVQKIGRKNIANRLYCTDLKKEFYQREELERERYVHDNSPAKMKDVDRAVTTAYTMLLRMLAIANNNDVDFKHAIVDMRHAINRIEDHLGIDKTEWHEMECQKEDNVGEVTQDTSKENDEQN